MNNTELSYNGHGIIPTSVANVSQTPSLDHVTAAQNTEEENASAPGAPIGGGGGEVAAVMKLLQETLPKLQSISHASSVPLSLAPSSHASLSYVSSSHAPPPYVSSSHVPSSFVSSSHAPSSFVSSSHSPSSLASSSYVSSSHAPPPYVSSSHAPSFVSSSHASSSHAPSSYVSSSHASSSYVPLAHPSSSHVPQVAFSPSRQPLLTSDSFSAPIPAVSPYICVGHQVPPLSMMTVGSAPKEYMYGCGPSPGSPVAAVPSPILWQHGSCILHPGIDERSPLLRSGVRPEVMSSGKLVPTASRTSQDVTSRRSKCRFSRRQILTLASMLLVDFSAFASMSVLAPFFPEQVKRLNLGPTFDGIIFSVYALVIVVASPLIGKLLPVMNSRKVYLTGILVAAIANVSFGMVQYITTPELFVVLTIFLRVAAALGSASFLTVIYSVVPILYPEDMNMVNGMMETAVGIGMCVGPAVGVWLYSIGGFCLPFYGLGGFIIFSAFINYISFPRDEVGLTPRNESGGLMKVLCRAESILPLVILCVTATSLGILYPTLEPHMSKLGVSVEGVGLVFLLMSAVYAVSSPLVGLATDRFRCPWGFMSSGLVIMAVALLLLGNSPLLPHETHNELYNQDVIAIVFLGLSSAMCIVPTFAALLESAARGGGEVDMATFSVVGGLWSSSYSLGEMLGPLLAGLMAEYTTFAMSTTVTAILPAALAIASGAFMCVERHRSRKMSIS